jgi:uncharacterized paraquat-inducible protein A
LFQTVPALTPGTSAHCARCPVSSHRAEHLIALAVAAVTLLIVMCSTQLMSVEKAGISHVAGLFSGPEELVHQNMAELAAVVIFVSVVAPFARLLGTVSACLSPAPFVRRLWSGCSARSFPAPQEEAAGGAPAAPAAGAPMT